MSRRRKKESQLRRVGNLGRERMGVKKETVKNYLMDDVDGQIDKRLEEECWNFWWLLFQKENSKISFPLIREFKITEIIKLEKRLYEFPFRKSLYLRKKRLWL
ncbi:hypothetical protein RUM43_009384 [Polyplax serrata]|uniref:Uncharacterized protein n=1 Tax=Polyplax serrata TaxID=468196 RepID=A0AAN8NW12_POLSC